MTPIKFRIWPREGEEHSCIFKVISHQLSHIITKYIALITSVNFPTARATHISQTLHLDLVHVHSPTPFLFLLLPCLILCSPPHPVPALWSLRSEHFSCPGIRFKLNPLMLLLSPFFWGQSHKLFLWRENKQSWPRLFFPLIPKYWKLSPLWSRDYLLELYPLLSILAWSRATLQTVCIQVREPKK